MRRALGIVILALIQIGAVTSRSAQAIPFEEARHLLARTGFGQPTPGEIEQLLPLDYGQAVDKLLLDTRTAPFTSPPPWAGELPPDTEMRRGVSEDAKRALRQLIHERAIDLKGWWIEEMIATSSPLTEHMVLFWHNHFTSTLSKVKWPGFIYRQNALFRRYGLGNFGSLLTEVARDPAMLIYLDGRTNHVGQPNENFARELFELFAFGEGKGYTEGDIREAARALTGWIVDPRTGAANFMPRRHDAGVKTVLGRNGRLGIDDVRNAVLDHPRLAEHIAEKMWREFISATPEPVDIRRLAATFRGANYEIKPLLRAILTRPQFRDPANRGTLIKSPTDLMIGTLRLFAAARVGRAPDRTKKTPVQGRELARAARALGQDLFEPPNVKGWPGGEAWITTASLPAREAFLRRVARGLDDAFPGDEPPPTTAMGKAENASSMEPHGRTTVGAGMGSGGDVVTGVGGSIDMNRGMQAAGDPLAVIRPTSTAGFDAVQIGQLILPLRPTEPIPSTVPVARQLSRLLLDPSYQLK